MQFLIVFSLAIVGVSAFDLRKAENELDNVVAPVLQKEGRITNGYNSIEGQFPHQVGLDLFINVSYTSWCGGSLIDKQWVLTAAHCTVDAGYAIVYLGATYRIEAEVTYTVPKWNIINHFGYNNETFENDIALIKIPEVSLTSRIQTVRLPSIGNFYPSYTGEYVIASGWGRTSDQTKFITDYLQWTRLQIISNIACRKTFQFMASSSMCVATPNGVSTCNGDSGGPLVLESNGLLVGLTSFGSIFGCEKGYPSAFTRITSHLNWIQFNTGITL